MLATWTDAEDALVSAQRTLSRHFGCDVALTVVVTGSGKVATMLLGPRDMAPLQAGSIVDLITEAINSPTGPRMVSAGSAAE